MIKFVDVHCKPFELLQYFVSFLIPKICFGVFHKLASVSGGLNFFIEFLITVQFQIKVQLSIFSFIDVVIMGYLDEIKLRKLFRVVLQFIGLFNVLCGHRAGGRNRGFQYFWSQAQSLHNLYYFQHTIDNKFIYSSIIYFIILVLILKPKSQAITPTNSILTV